jgi:predicted Zn-ribbon and HTH transcriptional regulator
MAKRKKKTDEAPKQPKGAETIGDETAPALPEFDGSGERIDVRPEPETETAGPGTGNAIDYAVADFVPIQCPSCKSEKREPFKGRTRKIRTGTRFHAFLNKHYNTVIFRPTRCSDCGQYIMSREFKLED